MRVTHVLRDGTVLDDISGKVVQIKDAKQAYILIEKISERENRVDERWGSFNKSYDQSISN